MKIRLILVLCVLVSSVLAAPSAIAATLSLDSEGNLSYEAAPGEVNAVVMTDGAISTDVVLTDTGAGTMSDTSGICTVVGNSATCHLAALADNRYFGLWLNDKWDTYNAAACGNCNAKASSSQKFHPIGPDGGSGKDTLVGSPNADGFDGGAGDDVIRGLAGDDEMSGGSGNDRMFGGAGNDYIDEGDLDRNGSDTMRGGPGVDSVSYELREGAVRLTLDGRRNDGQRGEHDKIASDVENLGGGDGNDTLIGNTRANFIDGGDGDDLLVGGTGVDHLDGGGGNDTIRSRDHSRDIVDGGDCSPPEMVTIASTGGTCVSSIVDGPGTTGTTTTSVVVIDRCVSDARDRVKSCERIR